MKLASHRNPAASGTLARTLCLSATLLAIPLASSLVTSCASTKPSLTAPKPAKTVSCVQATPYLDSAIYQLCQLDSSVAASSPSVKWGTHGADLRQLKKNNAGNTIFIAALEDFIRMMDEVPKGFPGYAALTDVKNDSVSLRDAPSDPTKILKISAVGSSLLGSAGAKFEIIDHNTGVSESFSITSNTGVDEFFRLRAAMCNFADGIVNLGTLSSLVTR